MKFFTNALIFVAFVATGLAQNNTTTPVEENPVGRDKPCNTFNNDCQSCIQYSNDGRIPAHTCNFCPKDGICHTIGSKLSPCSSSECISLSKKSECKMNTIQDCNAFVPYGKDAN